MGLFGPGKPNANHTQAALNQRQRAARREDVNASTRPNQSTLAEVRRIFGRRPAR